MILRCTHNSSFCENSMFTPGSSYPARVSENGLIMEVADNSGCPRFISVSELRFLVKNNAANRFVNVSTKENPVGFSYFKDEADMAEIDSDIAKHVNEIKTKGFTVFCDNVPVFLAMYLAELERLSISFRTRFLGENSIRVEIAGH